VSQVVLVVHAVKPRAAELAVTARRWWLAAGREVLEISGTDDSASLELDAKDVELVVSLGGDGTMLRAVELAHPSKAPVLGVNLGRIGYLTEVDALDMERAFEQFAAGEFTITERMTLQLEVRLSSLRRPEEDPTSHSLVALNEAAVEKVEHGHTIRFNVWISGNRFLTYAADGVVLCTPTGSTAYNLSARGPILSPTLRAMVLTPISPHMLLDRSLVLDPAASVILELVEGPPATLVVDGGRQFELQPGDSVVCEAHDHPARIVSFGRSDFLTVLRDKFGLADR
jgi:NAD+ kinase